MSSKPILLRCISNPYRDQFFELDMENMDHLRFRHGPKEIYAGTPHTFFDQFVRFPSFADSIKYFQVQFEGRHHDFEPNREQLEILKGIRDVLFVSQNPGAINSIRLKAIGWTLLGVAGVLLGLAGILIPFFQPDIDHNPQAFVILFISAAPFARAVTKFRQVRSMEKLQKRFLC